MKKMMNFKSLAMIIAMILSMSVVSCVPEPDGPSKPEADQPGISDSTTEYVKVVADFSLELTDGFLKLYDVVSVVTIDDKVINEEVTDVNYRFVRTFEIDEKPSNISCKIVGTAKNPIPEFEEQAIKVGSTKASAVYYLDKNNVKTLVPVKFDGTAIISSMTFSSSKVQDYVTKFPVREFMNVTYELK